ncbi:MAG: ATP-binding protein [Nocardiopsaceae bacterium]|nr:ATP-binding protein [Nocardiopsaceae bacterium]
MAELVPRMAQELLDELVSALRVVIVNGPRQSGKTTLLKKYQNAHGGTYRTLDNRQDQEAAVADPAAFAAEGSPPRLIDEVHRGGDWLVRAIKIAVDEDPRPGQFILSGSSRFLAVPSLSESLAGRAAFVDLWPLSMAEQTGGTSDFITRVFRDPASLGSQESAWTREDYVRAICAGGYPEVLSLTSRIARRAWFDGYLTTVINRDISDFAEIGKIRAIPQLLSMVTARSGTPVVITDLARSVELDRATVRTYLTYLDTVFLTAKVPFWSTNLTSRLSKSPKVFVTDSGLATHLLGLAETDLSQVGHPAFGNLTETFVFTELLKLRTVSETSFTIYQFREREGREVDFVLEGPGGAVVGIEVKSSTSPGTDSAKHLRWLQTKLGDRFIAGVVLHLGTRASSFGDSIYALPVSALWGHATSQR